MGQQNSYTFSVHATLLQNSHYLVKLKFYIPMIQMPLLAICPRRTQKVVPDQLLRGNAGAAQRPHHFWSRGRVPWHVQHPCVLPLKWGQQQWPQVAVLRGTGRQAPSGSHGRAPTHSEDTGQRGGQCLTPRGQMSRGLSWKMDHRGCRQQEARWLCLAPAGGNASLCFLSCLRGSQAGLPGLAAGSGRVGRKRSRALESVFFFFKI